MSEIKEIRNRRRRSDADRSRGAILAAAVTILSEDPEAKVEAIAAAAGVTRQTVYAHFPARGALLAAVADHLTAEALAAYNELDLDSGSAMDAVFQLIDTGRRLFQEHPVRLYPAAAVGDPARHEPVVELLTRIVRRGRSTGEISRDLPVGWQVRSIIALSHAAESPTRETPATLRKTLRRLLGTGQPG